MKQVRILHNEAIELAEKAFTLKRRGETERAKSLFAEAFALERKAALAIPVEEQYEPSRSILCRSAAALALNAELFRESEIMVAQGLIGFPPHEIAEELRDLFAELCTKRQLEAR